MSNHQDATPPSTEVSLDAEMGVAAAAASGASSRQFRSSFLAPTDESKRGSALIWRNINLNLTKGQQVIKPILTGAWGEALPNETTAIMGASGAGKTSLFNALSGRIPTNGPLKMDGEIRFGDVKVDSTNIELIKKRMAFVAQEDTLHEASTPREAIRFSARLRLPRETTDEEIDALVSHYLTELGLDKAADSVIGGGLKKGISGGEKKRTSTGVELVTSPSIILLDEPTSGLDSFAAGRLMALLGKIARAGNTVLFTIHQPSSKIFFSFDKVILLNAGRLMHMGPTSEIPMTFKTRGHPVAEHTNPADWILEIAQDIDSAKLESVGFFPADERSFDDATGKASAVSESSSQLVQTKMLLKREWITFKRIPLITIINVVITIILALFCGILFYQIGAGDRTEAAVLQGTMGSVVNILLLAMMGQATSALMVFANEKPLFLREYSANTYAIVPYVVSHFVTEILNMVLALFIQSIIVYFLIGFRMNFFIFFAISLLVSLNATAVAGVIGASVSDAALASAMFPLVIVPQFYFSGVLVAVSLIPSWLRWLQYVCALRYATALSVMYEFDACTANEQESCDYFLEVNDVDPANKTWYWIVFILLAVVSKLASVIILRKKSSNYA